MSVAPAQSFNVSVFDVARRVPDIVIGREAMLEYLRTLARTFWRELNRMSDVDDDALSQAVQRVIVRRIKRLDMPFPRDIMRILFGMGVAAIMAGWDDAHAQAERRGRALAEADVRFGLSYRDVLYRILAAALAAIRQPVLWSVANEAGWPIRYLTSIYVGDLNVLNIIAQIYRAGMSEGIHPNQIARALWKNIPDLFDMAALYPAGSNPLQRAVNYWRMWARTNLNQAYNSGRFAALQKNDYVEILVYMTQGDERVRPYHASLHGFSASKDDPNWASLRPPIDYNCRCWLDGYTRRAYDMLSRQGLIPESAVRGFDGALDLVRSNTNFTVGMFMGSSIEKALIDAGFDLQEFLIRELGLPKPPPSASAMD